ncbi:hypothetical protein D1BOALGB6SA_7532 [Olavius sp. associated proteobacterium Delta 1]|nr:hypothetical protein D1BOALGB6SA_7532 [Olavius sp. associated proteobacterium Delta 1]
MKEIAPIRRKIRSEAGSSAPGEEHSSKMMKESVGGLLANQVLKIIGISNT